MVYVIELLMNGFVYGSQCLHYFTKLLEEKRVSKKYYYFCVDCSDEITSDVELDEETKCKNCGKSDMIDITPNEKLNKLLKDSVRVR